MGELRGFRTKFDGSPLLALAAAVFLCAGTGAESGLQAQAPLAKTMLVEPPAPLLPERFGSWTHVPSDSDGGLAAGDDGASEAVLKEDGMTRFASGAYRRDKSSETMEVKVFQFGDASGAYAAYTHFRGTEPTVATVVAGPVERTSSSQPKLGEDETAGVHGILFREGTTVVMTRSATLARAAELAPLAAGLPKVGGAAGIAPLLPTLLPKKGLDTDSVKYALGPVGYGADGGVLPPQSVGFDKSAETVTAKYKGEGTLTMALYPTPQIAGDHARTAQSDLKNLGTTVGTVLLRRDGPLVIFTTGAWKPNAAKAMVDGVHLRQEVSFDKPMPLEFHAEVQKTYSLLVSIAIFCGIAALAMLVLGLFFGGGRALIRVMQGKPAATEPEFLRIDLRGCDGKRWGGPQT